MADIYSVYTLQSKKDGWLYIGMSQNPKKRLTEHNKGWTISTRSRVPFELIYSEEVGTRSEARKREKWLKSGEGREWIREIFLSHRLPAGRQL